MTSMEEAVYVIRLKQSSPSNIYKQIANVHHEEQTLPSEHRYSASLVKGLGIVHVTMGVVSALLTLGAVFGGEREINGLASGLWAGFVYVGCGILGLLASARWYVRRQIWMFLMGSILTLMCGITCIVITSIDLHRTLSRSKVPVQSIFTANIYIATVFEILWSTYSIKISFDGSINKEYDFKSRNQSLAIRTIGNRLSSSSASKLQRREFVLEAELPPGYSPGVLSAPDLLCHLTNPKTDQFHVTRVNPLCRMTEEASSGFYTDSFSSFSESWVHGEASCPEEENNEIEESEGLEEKVHRLLAHAAEMAYHNSNTSTGSSGVKIPQTYRSVDV